MPAKVVNLDDVRRFQSEIAAIREAPEPYAVRMTVHVLAVTILFCVVASLFAKVDRIVTST